MKRAMLIILVLILSSASTVTAQQREYHLIYKMKVGDVHTFDLVTEQHVVGRRAVRVATDMSIDVLNNDHLGNYECRMSLTIDRDSTDLIPQTQDLSNGAFVVAGERSYSRVEGYDAVINSVGNIVIGQTVQPHNLDQRIFTLSSQTTDFSMTERPVAPYEVNFTLSSAPGENPVTIGVPYEDTIFVTSAVQRVSKTIGFITAPMSEPPAHLDTLFRVMTLDSIVTVDQRQVGHITSRGLKRTVLGQQYEITTQYYREMTSGLIDSLHETCIAVLGNGKRRLEYVTVGRRRHPDAYSPMTLTQSPR